MRNIGKLPGLFNIIEDVIIEAIVIVTAPLPDGAHNSRRVKKYEYNNAFPQFFTPLLLHPPSGGSAGTIMMAFHEQINLLLFYAP
jgi:hypothetical protein